MPDNNNSTVYLFDDTDLLDFLILMRLGGGLSSQLYNTFLNTREVLLDSSHLSESELCYHKAQYTDMRELLKHDKYLYDNFYFSEYLDVPGQKVTVDFNPIKIIRNTGAKQVFHVTAHKMDTQDLITFIIDPVHVKNLKLLMPDIIRSGDFVIVSQGKHHHTGIKITRVELLKLN